MGPSISISLIHLWLRGPWPLALLQYEEVARVCSQLKLGVCGVLIDYENVTFDLWILLQDVYQEYFESCMISKSLKSGIILPLFKGKGAKATIRIITEE